MLLIVGGENDPNIQYLIHTVEARDVPYYFFRINPAQVPAMTWDIKTDRLIINGDEYSPNAVFYRDDVFSNGEDLAASYRMSQNWTEVIRGWLLAHPQVVCFNATYRGMNKMANLYVAYQVGLHIPDTVVSNELRHLRHLVEDSFITKPIAGGEYTITLEKYLQNHPAESPLANYPTFIQTKLAQPEMRIFVIGQSAISFWMHSPSLDYRANQDANVVWEKKLPLDIVEKLQVLMQKLQMNFGAVDLKTNPDTQLLEFLEINSNPMFAAFDKASNGLVSKKMLDFLLKNSKK
jgi:glutathione synthase/RimK-type ligase-like ATP-grasp enzyme